MSDDFPKNSSVYFKPFKGKRYRLGFSGAERKLLVLGESHYIERGDDPGEYRSRTAMDSFTEKVVRDFWTTKDGSAYLAKDFFGRLHRVLTGLDEPAREDIELAWSKIVYTNYIQLFAGDGVTAQIGEGAAAPKRADHWKSGHAALPEIMRTYRPDRVLVLGKSNWDHIHYGEWFDRDWKSSDGLTRGLWAIPTSETGDIALATWVMHPSWGRDSVATMRLVLHDLLSFEVKCSETQ